MVARFPVPPAVPGPLLTYCVDRDDRLVALDPAWVSAALEHGAPELMPEKIEGLSLWDMISDPGVRDLYGGLIFQARKGRVIRFNYRCDTPELQRVFSMELRRLPTNRVQFSSQLIRAQERAPVALLQASPDRAAVQMLTHCSWCQRVTLSGKHWIELEHAVQVLNLAALPELPQLKHEVCDPCRSSLSRFLAD